MLTKKRMSQLINMSYEKLKNQNLTKEEKRYLQNGIDSSSPLNKPKVKFTKKERKEARKILLDVIKKI